MPRIVKIDKGNWLDLRVIEGGTITRDGNKTKAKWENIETEIDGIKESKIVLKYKKGDFLMLSLGVSIVVPDGYEIHILPRSSTYKKYNLIQTNSMGVGDSTFRGNNDVYHFPCYAFEDGEIELYDRVCQFRIQESMSELTIVEVEDTGYEDRSGFGSTGKKDIII